MSDSKLYDVYMVRRRDGQDRPGKPHADCHYFVLDMDCDPAACDAMMCYAEFYRESYPEYYEEIMKLIRDHGGVCSTD